MCSLHPSSSLKFSQVASHNLIRIKGGKGTKNTIKKSTTKKNQNKNKELKKTKLVGDPEQKQHVS